MIWFALLVPIVFSVLLITFFKHKVVLWELALPMLITVIVIAICKWVAINAKTTDTEYWGSYVTEARYYEDWNERVTCTHTRTCRDSKGNSYSCGTEHAYDVDYHPEYYEVITNTDEVVSITERKFYHFVDIYKNKHFKELNRDYHTDDGDMYYSRWNGDGLTFTDVVTMHTYENRVQASTDVFNFEDVSKEDIETYKLFEYPKLKDNFRYHTVLGLKQYDVDKMYRTLNAQLGKSKKLRLWILVHKNQPLQAGVLQQHLWKNGNKNEFVINIGVDEHNNINWVYVFSWAEDETLKINIRNKILDSKTLDLVGLYPYIYHSLNDGFVKKSFDDFKYINVEPSDTSVVITFLIAIIVNILIAIYVIKNEFTDEENKSRFSYPTYGVSTYNNYQLVLKHHQQKFKSKKR